MNKALTFIVLSFLLLTMTGCADSVSFARASELYPVGFWHGLWHGGIAPFAWIVSLFSDNTAIYAIYNNGGWYDFGFVLGIGALTGGTAATT